MPYILNKTDGSIVATVQDASLDQTTDLSFVGRNYAGYGEIQNENFLKLLENFSNITPPSKPIEGQIWFDKTLDNKKLNVYDGNFWKTIANLEVNSVDPFKNKIKDPKPGDLWYDTVEGQLYVFNGGQYVLIGPSIGADTQAGWRGDADTSTDQLGIRNYNIKAVIGLNNDVVAVISASNEYDVSQDFSEFTKYGRGSYEKIYKGITLVGANKDTGVSYTGRPDQAIFWGTAAHALNSNTATNSLRLVTTEVNNANTHYIPFVSLSSGSSEPRTHFNLTYTPPTLNTEGILKSGIFEGTATRARYADLAERYESDQYYDTGTVVVIGGIKEITISNKRADTAVAGVISKNPAYMMNSEAGTNETHPYVALKGRVLCRVRGKIRKGDMLVTSIKAGHAESWQEGDSTSAVFARALQDFDGGLGMIEVKI